MKSEQSIWAQYRANQAYDEMMDGGGQPRQTCATLSQYLQSLGMEAIKGRLSAAEAAILEMGITFTVYSDEGNIDRAWPFDIIPRLIDFQEWRGIDAGLRQRLRALNHFIDDVYNERRIIQDGVVPAELIASSSNFRPECVGFKPKFGVWANICGSDLVRGGDGVVHVLEDNLRVPSGVSYMIENRVITKRVFPELLENLNILPVDDYPTQLFEMLTSIAPRPEDQPQIAVLTPGIYNSAYFEHAFLAQQMGAELVEGGDLVVKDDDCVYMRTVKGLERVDVIYRRIDDMFLDPEVFRKDSVLGVKGLLRAWKAGNVALANAPGAGVADDKVVYAYVPAMIRYYLNEEPLLPNVPTYLCSDPEQCAYVLEHLAELVVKPANESGGYGMLVGPHATQKDIKQFHKLIQANPRNYIAQPTLALSTCPTLCGDRLEPRHIDLRPFILQGERGFVTAGGLTRVALKAGSLVVNSSQGGGSKDTWIINREK
ncbi:circularly permuted type 2 ATP-grasp protein [Methylomonas sp. UP202]|uniref:circularly permuted type 2 ATP-grasp protein n=1 Tax=Methylomonas sp. UP202 TaxID=3040943 RepID=UPI00247A24ED|nr:circularly permuted type 2 ATP-grasp protein [Methylomonas sp. UP202]WGS87132.1 circularly permuted type 2 ATP-grasp protein [Methylomonas sp. UP202]